ncbi:MAG: cysteine--tRNA ligase [Holosporaceae bacterium]|jgi:cysteinyl-tRNA synthetase|nr:cysteine--tRNA ligase [Holosporaceae bacterium]
MHKLQLYNSLSNSIETFVPLDEKNVRMYVCGPTVYASPHIGNARPLVIFDILLRVLRKIYDGNVTYVRNITDVDDKINAAARERNISIQEITDAVIAEFHTNSKKLNLLPATVEPRATLHIAEMLNIIGKLIENGFAYEAEGHVLFRVKKMPKYGALSKINVDDMIAGSRVEIAPYKEDPLDFVLWKPSNEGTPSWDSDFGSGRPGWHIECSAMSHKYLGEQFDIHAGGQDLMFPHHENELAQNFGAFGCTMAKYWIHNNMLVVNGQKMSKSFGNVVALDKILQEYDGEIIRYVLLSSHYQKILNWTNQALYQAKQGLDRLYGALRIATADIGNICECCSDSTAATCISDGDVTSSPIIDALCNNLNTPLALHNLHLMADEIFKMSEQECNRDRINGLCASMKNAASLLGLLWKSSHEWFQAGFKKISENEISQLIEDRAIAKMTDNFERADEIREQLLAYGVIIEDSKEGTMWKIG